MGLQELSFPMNKLCIVALGKVSFFVYQPSAKHRVYEMHTSPPTTVEMLGLWEASDKYGLIQINNGRLP